VRPEAEATAPAVQLLQQGAESPRSSRPGQGSPLTGVSHFPSPPTGRTLRLLEAAGATFGTDECLLLRLGLLPYDEALDLQFAALAARAEGRVPDMLLLLEHPPVITLGRAADTDHVLASAAELTQRGIAVRETGRGGDVTLHSPGQLVGYPILDLRRRGRDVHRYLRDLEEVLIRALAGWGVSAARIPGATGVWVGNEKVAAIGVAVKRWVTCHGFALNVCNDLTLFEMIVPCGLWASGVTSVERLLGRVATVEEAADRVARVWPSVFPTRPRSIDSQRWLAALHE
jgi:lipoyl(octanoyl) transferase